jgi:hypothetical protein
MDHEPWCPHSVKCLYYFVLFFLCSAFSLRLFFILFFAQFAGFQWAVWSSPCISLVISIDWVGAILLEAYGH